MHTNLNLDEQLVAEALQVTGLRTKKAVVEEGLRALIRLHEQADVRRLRSRGAPVPGQVDCLIATFCIRTGIPLLHNDPAPSSRSSGTWHSRCPSRSEANGRAPRRPPRPARGR